MPIKKDYVLVSSDTAKALDPTASPTQFTLHLIKPLKDVIKTDLVMFSLDNSNLSELPAFLLVQSTNLGGDVTTATNTLSYWRLLPLKLNSQSGVYQFANARVDGYLDYPRTIQDIDITLVQPDGSLLDPSFVTNFTLLIEVERMV
jgi:hypothetical protein